MNPADPSNTWSGLMQFGFGVLGLSSTEFWSLSLPELHEAMRLHQIGRPPIMTRTRLNQLMQIHPDQPEEGL